MRNQAARTNGHDFDNPQSRLLEAITSIYQDIDVDKELTWKPEATALQKLTKLLCKTYVLNMSKMASASVQDNLEKNGNVIDRVSLRQSLETIMREQMSAVNLQFCHRYENLKEGNHWDVSVVLGAFKKEYITVLQDKFSRKFGDCIMSYKNEALPVQTTGDVIPYPQKSL